jgi:tetratricopeptide (TPR) repeat protein
MKLKLRALVGGVALSALIAGCAGVGGLVSDSGCHTIYVFKPTAGGAGGVVQPISSCAGALPRDTLQKSTLMAGVQSEAVEPLSADGEAASAETAPVDTTSISDAAKSTAPRFGVPGGYPGANEMLENGDMAAFMTRVHNDYAAKKNAGAWGYVILDALAAGDTPHAQDVLDAMASKPPPEILSAVHLRPWVMAFAGRGDTAQTEMAQLRRLMPTATLLGHRALLAEGLGDTAGALAIYDEAPDAFDPPKPEEAATPGYLARAIAFNGQRLLALRQAELMRATGHNDQAIVLLSKLLAAGPDDLYVQDRLDKASRNVDRKPLRTLPQALALALADEADLVEERQSIMGMMVGRGGKTPFNYLLSSLRQSALLLDADNGDIRLAEVNELYQHGHFEAALRIAQLGNPPKAQAAGLASAAGLAALELGSPETMLALTDRALAIDSSPDAKLSAAAALTSAGYTDRAEKLIDQAIKQGMPDEQKVFALMSKGQAKFQGGDVAGAVQLARDARALKDNENTQQFLASMLVKSPGRPEGLQIMRDMMADSPGDTGLMNNFGYSLVDGPANTDELDEGFKLLKEASRLAPDEPNLLDSLGWAYYQFGDFREAKRYIDLALEAYKPFAHWELNDHIGDVEWRLGEEAEARKHWQIALDSRPPEQEKASIAAKLKDGLTTPPPVRRDTPEVPLIRGRGESNDI